MSLENKERTYFRNEVSFSQIKGNKSQKHLDNYLEKHNSQEDDKKIAKRVIGDFFRGGADDRT